jgi:demethylmenaquinone methyltransferase/2-methoxy-6-polyprenyl-1,4-benzoquinol methylase
MAAEAKTVEPGVLRVFQSKAQVQAYYDKIAKVYDLLAEHEEGPMRDLGLRLLAAAPGEKALEVGCGTGHCLVELAKAVGPRGKVVGLDLSPNMLAEALKTVTHAGCADRVELRQGDGEKLPFADGSFDALFMSFTLELFDTPAVVPVLVECRRVLRAGGRLGVVGMSKEGKGVLLELYEWTHKHFPNLMDCRPIFVRQAVEAAGFTIREARVEKMWVPVEIVIGVKG